MTVRRHGAQWASSTEAADLPQHTQSAPRSGRPWRIAGRRSTLLRSLVLAAVASSTLLLTGAPAAQAGGALKAVIIVGPGATMTAEFVDEGRLFARQAEAAGMDVTRIIHPRATWSRVKNRIQGADLVVYFGHGNGWPSPYAPFQENTKNGFGLNPYRGASAYQTDYHGGNDIRSSVRLAPNAVVILYRSCYSAGNGEEGQAVPSRRVAIKRVDNFAAAFLSPKVGASVVMAYRTKQYVNFAGRLTRRGLTMDDVFRTRSSKPGWLMSGWMGTNDFYASSDRRDGARIHLDPHSRYGYSRSITGKLDFTTDRWLSQ